MTKGNRCILLIQIFIHCINQGFDLTFKEYLDVIKHSLLYIIYNINQLCKSQNADKTLDS